jgi:tetratricopeptide (TPR) repeat protein
VDEDEIIKNALAGNVLFYIKTPDSTGFTQENNVYLYPTFLVLNSEGDDLYTWIGWPGAEEWARRMEMATREAITLNARKARLGADPSFRDAYMIGTAEFARKNTRGGHDYFRLAMELDEAAARLEDVPILLFNTAYYGVRTGDFTMEECAAAAEEVLLNEQASAEDALQITGRLVRVIDNMGEETVASLLEMALPLVEEETSEDLYVQRQRFYASYTMIVEKDPAKAVGFQRETMPEGWMDEPRHLNSFAWWCFENKVNLEEAEELSRRSVDLAQDARVRANCLDTLAEIVNLRGDTAGALDLINQGLEIDPDNEYLKKQRTRFEEELALAS